MSGVSNGESQNIINQIVSYIKNHAPEKDIALLVTFAQRYYLTSSVEDLKERSIEELYQIMLSHWNFIYQRSPGEAKVKVFNPEMAKDGWTSDHTVIQISHDDIPFQVDSAR